MIQENRKKPVGVKKSKSNARAEKSTSNVSNTDQAAVIKDLMAKYSRGGVIAAPNGSGQHK